jgi:hypothetical protein
MLLGVRCEMKKWSRDPPPAHRGGLLPAQLSHPGCRDEKNSTDMLFMSTKPAAQKKTRPSSAD